MIKLKLDGNVVLLLYCITTICLIKNLCSQCLVVVEVVTFFQETCRKAVVTLQMSSESYHK